MAQFLAGTVPAVFWTPDGCHLAWMIDTVCLGACLPHLLLVPFGLIDTVCLGPVALIPGFPVSGWIRRSVPWACLHPPWVNDV